MAFFHSSGILPCCKEAVKIKISVSTITSEHSFSILADMSSGPLALEGFSSFKSFKIPFFVKVISPMGIVAFGPLTSGDVPSSVVNTLENWLLRISALSLSSVWIVPLSCKGLTPITSDFLDLISENSFLDFPSFSKTFSLMNL